MDHGHTGEIAELMSAGSQLSDLLARVTAAAERFQAQEVDDAANDLYEVERNLLAARRRLDVLLRRYDA